MTKTIIDSFTIGGTKAGPSVPGPALQRMIGTRISLYPTAGWAMVPTPHGQAVAKRGDRIVLYDDGTLEVDYGKNT